MAYVGAVAAGDEHAHARGLELAAAVLEALDVLEATSTDDRAAAS